MHMTSEEKLEAEHQFREWLREYELPEPDEVEYGFTCLRFYYRESKVCVRFDLDPDGDAEAEFFGEEPGEAELFGDEAGRDATPGAAAPPAERA